MKIYFDNFVCGERIGSDLYTEYCGRQNCHPSHSFGPYIRRQYLMHYILEGKGTYCFNGKTYELSRDEGFLIFPGDSTSYQADSEKPWHYAWVGFNGVQAKSVLTRCGLTRQSPTFKCEKPVDFKRELFALLEDVKSGNGSDFAATGRLYILLSHLFKRDDVSASAPQKLFTNAVAQIGRSYGSALTVESLAKTLFIDRSHLFRVFIACSGQSPSAYITDYRMKKAAELLSYSGYSITEIARHCGYPDISAFCKAFKKAFDVSAKDYKKQKEQ